MFSFFKKKKNNALEKVKEHLKVMGYDLLPYGAAVATAELKSGYNAVEVASHIAHTTMALDIKEAGEVALSVMSFRFHAEQLIRVITEYKDMGLMHPTQWQNDSRAVYHISVINEEQNDWLDTVLSDPVAGKERLAISRIKYGDQ